MGFYKWKNNFNTGIYVIDHQHQEFMALVNDCYEVSTHVKQSTVGHDLLNNLKLYILDHFSFEESLLINTGFTRFNHHKFQHDLFAARITELEHSQRNGNSENVAVFLPLVRDWFLNHIIDYDLKYVPYLLDQHIAKETERHSQSLANFRQ